MNVNPETFYDRILYILKLRNISLVSFYQDLHLAKSTVQYWKKNNIPSGETSIVLSKYLDVLPEWLISGNTDCNSSEKVPQSIIVTRIYNKLHDITKLDEDNELFFAPLDNNEYIIKLLFWDKGFQRVDLESLVYISEKLNISLDKLIANKTTEETRNEKISVINETEEYLLKYYRLLSPSGRKKVYDDDYSTFIKEQYDKSIKEKNTNSPFKQDWDPYEDPNFDDSAFSY